MKSVRLCNVLICAAAFLSSASGGMLPPISQGFNDISTLAASGWVMVNNNTPPGQTAWFQGDPALLTAQSGAPNSYIAANFMGAGYGGNISLWLISPELTLQNGVTLSFYTVSAQVAPDNLEVRYSLNGSSTDVGATDTSFGDFSNLLLAVNPSLSADGYPGDWTLETLTISGLEAPITGRIAFRYFITDTSINGDYIGIDSVLASAPIPEPSTVGLSLLGLAGLLSLARRRRKHNGQ